jgi:hypothetical protein
MSAHHLGSHLPTLSSSDQTECQNYDKRQQRTYPI